MQERLSPWKDENGEYKFYGRFNQGVVTINLPDVVLSPAATWRSSGRSSMSVRTCATVPSCAVTTA